MHSCVFVSQWETFSRLYHSVMTCGRNERGMVSSSTGRAFAKEKERFNIFSIWYNPGNH